MKFFKKKSQSFYVLLTLALCLPAVMPDKLTPKASALVMLSASWGAGAVTWAGPAITAALVGLFFANKVSNKSDATTSSGQQSVYTRTQDNRGLQPNMGLYDPANSTMESQSIDASLQQGMSISSSDVVECIKGIFIAGKSIANISNYFSTKSDESYRSQSNKKASSKGFIDRVRDTTNHCLQAVKGKTSFTTQDFSGFNCRNWSVNNYRSHLVRKHRLCSPDLTSGYGLRSESDFDRVLPEAVKRDLFQDLDLYKRPAYVKFLATLTCPQDLQRDLLYTDQLYKHSHVIELYKTFDCYEQYLPLLLAKSCFSGKKITPLGKKVHDICMKKIEVTEWDSLVKHEACGKQALSQTEARALALQKFRPELLDRWHDLWATCTDLDSLFSENFFIPGKYHKVSSSVRKMAQGHGVKVGGKILQSDTLKSRLQVGILRLLEEVHTFYNKNRKNTAMRVVVPYVEKFLVHALSHANENNLDSSFGLFNCGFVTFKVLTGSQSDGLSYGIGALLPSQAKRELYTLYCLYPNAQFRKLLTTLDSFNGYYQEFAEQLGVIGKNTAQKEQFAHDVNEDIRKNGLWDPSMTAEERAAFDIREVMRNDLKLMGVYETAQAQELREHQHTTTDPPKIQYEYHGKDTVEYVNEAQTSQREPTAAELIAERAAQKTIQKPIASIVHPASADCKQKTSSTQKNQASSTTQSVEKIDEQIASQEAQAAHELQQAVYVQAASDHQKGLDLYGDKLTDAQRTRFQNRRDAFLEAYNNPNKTSEYNYSLPTETQLLFKSVGINVDQFMHGSGDAIERVARAEQAQIAEKYQEFATQMPAGASRDFVLSEILTKVHIASNLQQCGLHQLSLIPIDQNWTLIDSIDQYGFNFIDQSFIQKIEENRHIDWPVVAACRATGEFAGKVAWHLGVGGCKAVANTANLMYLTVSNIPAAIKASADLVNNKNAAIDLLFASATKKVGAANLTLLACGVPESALKDQMVHWSEQQHADAAICVEQARERFQAIVDNPIPTTIHAIGNHLAHDAKNGAITTYNILYGLSCMEAACETYDKDHEIALFEQGEKLLQENLPSVEHAAEFAGEMLVLHYGPGFVTKYAEKGYKKILGRFATKVESTALALEKGLQPTIELMPDKPIRIFTDAEILVMERDGIQVVNLTPAENTASALEKTLIEKRVSPEAILSAAEESVLPGVATTEEAKFACASSATGDSAAVKQGKKSLKKKSGKQTQKAVDSVEKDALASIAKVLIEDVRTKNRWIFIWDESLTGADAVAQKARLAEAQAARPGISVVSKQKVMEASMHSQEWAEKFGIEQVNGAYDFGEKGFEVMFDLDGYSFLSNYEEKEFLKRLEGISFSVFENYKINYPEFIAERAKALEALRKKLDITIQDGLDWRHIAFPGYKKGKIPGFHTPRYCPEVIVKLEKKLEHSMEVIVGLINDEGVLMLDTKTIFLPWLNEYEIDCLFNRACINIDTYEFKPRRESWTVISKPIDGQRYQWFVDTKGVLKSFFPTNLVE